jgi:hypothetical protein
VPKSIQFVYANMRFSVPELATPLADLRLILGHSALYVPEASLTPSQPGAIGVPYAADNGQPPVGTGTSDQPRADVAVHVNGVAAAWPWEHGTSPYTFGRADLVDAVNADQSSHWYVDMAPEQLDWSSAEADNWLEPLPDQRYQSMLLQRDGAVTLASYNTLEFVSRVSPVRDYDGTTYTWGVPPKDLSYLLGPVAIAPPRTADPLQVEIDALIYAQNGSWFVLPGRWFNDNPAEFSQDPATLPTSEYPGYHEPLNIRISVHGAIGENMPADLGSVADWTSKWCGPVGQEAQHFLSYTYDPLLRYPRRETRDRIGYLRFPNFPLTSDLVIWGERVTGPAGS